MHRSLIAISCIFACLFPAITHAETGWPDLETTHPYYQSLVNLQTAGIMDGFPDGTIKPYQGLNRVEGLKIILDALDTPIPDIIDEENINFVDINENQIDGWYIPYIAYANDKKIMQGYEDKSFRIQKPMTQAEFIKVLLFSGNIRPQITKKQYFEDVKVDDWLNPMLSFLYENNIIPNEFDKYFEPNKIITRSLAAYFVDSLYLQKKAYVGVRSSLFSGDREIRNNTDNIVLLHQGNTAQVAAEESEENNNEQDENIILASENPPLFDNNNVSEASEIDEELQQYLKQYNLDTGIASYYHDKFNGQNTANGETFDNNLFTAAHPWVPFGTMLRVTHQENNQSVDVRVNDCGPFSTAHERVIDLSSAAFEKLSHLGAGLIPVNVEILSLPENPNFREVCVDITYR